MGDMSTRIYQLRKRLGLTQGELAELLGVTQATVSRWEKNAEPTFEHAQRLAQLAGQTVEDFSGQRPHKWVKVEPVPVIGAVEAGNFKNAVEWEQPEHFEVYWVPRPEYRGIPKFGLEVIGPSMDLIYPEGSVVICVRVEDVGRLPLSGERVVVYTSRPDGTVEATLKEYVQENGKVWLWPRSRNPRYQAPVPYDDSPAQDDLEVRVHAIVIGSYRPEPV